MAASKPKAAEAVKPARRYFIVNPAGALHEVTREHASELLRSPGFRMATPAEVEQLHAQGGEQRFDQPICTPWSPDPDVQMGDPDAE